MDPTGAAAFIAPFVPTDRPRPPATRTGPLSAALSASLAALAPATAQQPIVHNLAREGLLGTSSALVVEAADAADVERVEAAVFGEVERLVGVLSTWDDDSELAGLVRAGHGEVSAELGHVLDLATEWRRRTDCAFEPGIAALTALWQAAAKRGAEPDAGALVAAVKPLADGPWTKHGATVDLRGPVTLDALAKGYVVDRAFAAGVAAGGTAARVLAFQIGGDVRLGSAPRKVGVVDPRAPSANGRPLARLRTADRAVASSGGYERGFRIGEVHHSHILDPRTGRPCDEVLGASVVAKDVATADVLATALCVLGPERGLTLLAANGADGVVVTADGEVHASPGWKGLCDPEPEPVFAASDPWPDGFALRIEFAIKGPAEVDGRRRGGWKRPYVAVWIEDITETPRRTLCLWLEDRRWLRDLLRWSRQYHDEPRVLETMSQATRKAGTYTLTWDGTDDIGRQLAPGHYTVCIEVVREHGSYQLLRHQLELGGEARHVELPGNGELERAALHFARPAPRSQR